MSALSAKEQAILDSTFSHYKKALQNVTRSLQRERLVHMIYVYQDPVIAWDFVRAREFIEGRRIQQDTFITRYFGARDVVQKIKNEFRNEISLEVLIKDRDNSTRSRQLNVFEIHDVVDERYTQEQLTAILPPLGAPL